MSGDAPALSLLDKLLLLSFRERFAAPDADAGLALLAETLGEGTTLDEWRSAIAAALGAGYIHDPVRLPAGALQCHWQLELTPTGVDRARRLRPQTGWGYAQ